MVAYSTARVTLDQTLGITLEANHITMNEVKSGKVSSGFVTSIGCIEILDW